MIEKLYAAVLLAAFLPFIIIFVLLWHYCSGVFSASIHQSAMESFRSLADRLQIAADDYQELGSRIMQDEQIRRLMPGSGNPSFLCYRINQHIRRLLPMPDAPLKAIYFLTQQDKEFLVLFDKEETHLSLRGSGADKYSELRRIAQDFAVDGRDEPGFFHLKGVPCVTLSIPAVPAEDGRKPAMLLLLEQEYLAAFAKHSSGDELPWAFHISAGDGRTIGEDPLFAKLLEGGELLESELRGQHWKLSCAVNTSKIRTDSLKRFGAMFIIVLLMYILLVILITGMVNRQLHSLMILRESMVRMGENGIYKEVSVSGDRDVAFVLSGYNDMVRKIKRQEDIIREQNSRNMKIAEKQRVAELKALELEINPHYLYNTLNTINSVAVEHGDYQVSRLLKGYSSTLVYMLRDRSQPVTIRQEADWLKEYLLLQQERFPGTFVYEVDTEPEISDMLLYKMLLQPFAENSILHGFEGFAEQKQDGFLSILFYGDGDRIVISIWDNGRGIGQEELEDLRRICAHPMETESERIGILNTCRRLYGYYGDRYALSIASEPGKGTRVELRLPFVQEEQALQTEEEDL